MTRRDDSARIRTACHDDTTGLAVLLSRLAPLAAVSTVPVGRSRSVDGRSGRSYLPGVELLDGEPHPDWAGEREVLLLALASLRLTVASPGALAELASGVEVDTNLADPPFTVFDAWFHWMD